MGVAKRQRARTSKGVQTLAAVPWGEVLENLTDAVLLLSPEGRVVSCNPAGELLLGRPESQMRGQDMETLFRRNPAVQDLVQRTLDSGQTQALNDESLLLNERRLTVRMVTSPLLDQGALLRGAAVVIHDLSHQRALREDAERAERLAELGMVAAGLAHEIKNPLAGIKGAAQLLQRDFGDNAAVREYAEVMVRETDRLTLLLEQLLHLGSPARAELSPLNIHRLIQDVLLLVREAPSARGIRIEIDFDPTLPPVRGDERQLKQVLLNLVANSLDAMQGNGTLSITTRMETDFHIVRGPKGHARLIRIEVADSGPGIPAEDLPHIFNPFFSTKTRGTGLGLAISHRIASEHGGTLRASVRPRQGTVMTLNLPVDMENP
jgi:two-component system, NtrC family, nitrogen regulation sensor histidine kinase GlnL